MRPLARCAPSEISTSVYDNWWPPCASVEALYVYYHTYVSIRDGRVKTLWNYITISQTRVECSENRQRQLLEQYLECKKMKRRISWLDCDWSDSDDSQSSAIDLSCKKSSKSSAGINFTLVNFTFIISMIFESVVKFFPPVRGKI